MTPLALHPTTNRPVSMRAMRPCCSLLPFAVLAALACAPLHGQEFEPLFDGVSLQGWTGDTRFWSVEDGTITGRSTKECPLPAGTYLYSDRAFGDFELRFAFRINSKWANSGVQYRSHVARKETYLVHGYQADIETGKTYNGILYDVGGRQFMARRGEHVVIDADGTKHVVGKTCDPDAAQASIKHGAWNEYAVLAYKNRLRHVINGHVAVEVEDNEPGKGALSGILGFQMHAGPPMEIQFKDIRIRRLTVWPELAAPRHESGGLQLLPGFAAERVYTVPKATQGSWISMTFDDRGRMIATAEDGWLYRVTFPAIGTGGRPKVEKLEIPQAKDTRGLLYAFGSLYVATDAIYRLCDTTGDDQFDEVQKVLDGVTDRSAHGSHAMVVTEDGKGIYFINGNFTRFGNNMPSRQPPVWKEDALLPAILNDRHAAGVRAPGAWVCRFEPDGSNPVMIASGMRNPCDLAINEDGELFTYDADMEWDMGTPWYRPTRINHLTSGAEFGWRTGSQKWPDYAPDSLGSVVDIGPGSPTGIVFGGKAKFPARYRQCLYVCDWTFGTLYAVHLTAQGASYRGAKEEFASRMGFPLVDVEVGADGALYLLTGGWKNQSEVYRIWHTGNEAAAASAVSPRDPAAEKLRRLRKELATLHRAVGPRAVDAAWGYLSHPDRHVRYAARIAVENQDIELWRERVFAEPDPVAAIHAVLALARHGMPELLPRAVRKLGAIDFARLSRFHQLGLLRTYGLVFSRWGRPSADVARQVAARLGPLYPSNDRALNRELCRLLSYLDDPGVVGKTVALMRQEEPASLQEASALLKRNKGNPRAQSNGAVIERMLKNRPNVENVYFLYALRDVTKGWTAAHRRFYFSWIKENARRNGGLSYPYFLNKIKNQALQHVPEQERRALASLLGADKPFDAAALPKATGPGRNWQTDEVLALLKEGLKKRSFVRGKRMYQAAHCAVCHKIAGEGGLVGPDLSSLGNRFSPADILESIREPSKVVNPFYQSAEFRIRGGGAVVGQVVEETETHVKVMVDPYNPNKLTTVEVAAVESRRPSAVSQMPPMLISMFNEGELLDFMAYVLSAGDSQHVYFK